MRRRIKERRKTREERLHAFFLCLPEKEMLYKTLRHSCGAVMNIWLGFGCLWFEHVFRVEKEGEEKKLTFATYRG